MKNKLVEDREKTGSYFQLGLNIGIWILYILWILFVSSTELTLINFLLHCVFLSIIIILNFDYLKKCFQAFKSEKKKVRTILLIVLILFGVLIISNVVISILSNSLNISDQSTKTIQELFYNFPWGTLFAFFLTAIFYPIVEELIFKKSLSDAIKSPVLFVIISSLLAWYFQVSLISPKVSEFVLGLTSLFNAIALGIVYIRKDKNVLYTIFPRVVFNIIISIFNIAAIFLVVI